MDIRKCFASKTTVESHGPGSDGSVGATESANASPTTVTAAEAGDRAEPDDSGSIPDTFGPFPEIWTWGQMGLSQFN